MKNFSALEASLANNIGKTNQFVFRIGGAFFLKDPIPTHNGDIDCEL